MLETGVSTKLIIKSLNEQNYCFATHRNGKFKLVELTHRTRVDEKIHEPFTPTREEMKKLAESQFGVISIEIKWPQHKNSRATV